jgi:hypothetical protein
VNNSDPHYSPTGRDGDSSRSMLPTDSEQPPDDPNEALDYLRRKMERLANDFADGRINRAQFNAIYGHYSEQRTIVERLLQRNPGSDAWRQVVTPGNTGFLRSHFEAQPVFFVVFRHHEPKPMTSGGEMTSQDRQQVERVLRALWKRQEIQPGLARREMEDGRWLVVAVGEQAVTLVIFTLQPSAEKSNLVRDLHADFERANRLSLRRQQLPERMVFPQRSLFG